MSVTIVLTSFGVYEINLLNPKIDSESFSFIKIYHSMKGFVIP